MGGISNKGIAEGAMNSILRQNNQRDLPPGINTSNSSADSMQNNTKSDSETAASEKLSASSISSRRGITSRRRRAGLINAESNDTLGAKGL